MFYVIICDPLTTTVGRRDFCVLLSMVFSYTQTTEIPYWSVGQVSLVC